jgi:hypothetical protein
MEVHLPGVITLNKLTNKFHFGNVMVTYGSGQKEIEILMSFHTTEINFISRTLARFIAFVFINVPSVA